MRVFSSSRGTYIILRGAAAKGDKMFSIWPLTGARSINRYHLWRTDLGNLGIRNPPESNKSQVSSRDGSGTPLVSWLYCSYYQAMHHYATTIRSTLRVPLFSIFVLVGLVLAAGTRDKDATSGKFRSWYRPDHPGVLAALTEMLGYPVTSDTPICYVTSGAHPPPRQFLIRTAGGDENCPSIITWLVSTCFSTVSLLYQFIHSSLHFQDVCLHWNLTCNVAASEDAATNLETLYQ